MSDVARTRNALWLVLAALLVVLLLRLVADDPTHGKAAGTGNGGAGVGASVESFTIDGSAAVPISPGTWATLDLRLTNPHDVAVLVTDFRVTVQEVRAPNADRSHPCVVGDFALGQARAGLEVTVARRSTSSLSSLGVPRAERPQVGMVNRAVNQDGCKGASVALAYAAAGTLQK